MKSPLALIINDGINKEVSSIIICDYYLLPICKLVDNRNAISYYQRRFVRKISSIPPGSRLLFQQYCAFEWWISSVSEKGGVHEKKKDPTEQFLALSAVLTGFEDIFWEPG